MRFINAMLRYIKNPFKFIRFFGTRGFFNWLPDKTYLKLIYFGETGQKLNLDIPKKYNEKLQWLKLYDREKEYSKYVDKFAVRSYISEKIGEKYLIPLIGVYNRVDEIDWDSLPNQFVLKCTHGSGSNIICKNKEELAIEESKNKLKNWMKKNWYWFGREWPYKNIKPRMICEQYMVDESGTELKDYKIFCFNGIPKLIQVDFNRFVRHERNLYTVEWKYIDATIKHPNNPSFNIPKPEKLEEMIYCAKMLSRNLTHVRVDFYSINNNIYFGEMTFYQGSGFEKFEPNNLEIEMGSWIKLGGLN